MTNRTEILHFRATPEEKETIRENAGHAELALSEWMRKRSLTTFEDPNLGISHEAVKELVPTQPAVEEYEEVPESGIVADISKIDPRLAVQRETYEQFMERRVPELCGESPSVAETHHAREAARAEWAERQ